MESRERYQRYVEAQRRGLSCGKTSLPSANQKDSSKSLAEALLEAKRLRDTLAEIQTEKDGKKAIKEDKESPIIKLRVSNLPANKPLYSGAQLTTSALLKFLLMVMS